MSDAQHKKKTLKVRKKPPPVVSKPKRHYTIARKAQPGASTADKKVASGYGSTAPMVSNCFFPSFTYSEYRTIAIVSTCLVDRLLPEEQMVAWLTGHSLETRRTSMTWKGIGMR